MTAPRTPAQPRSIGHSMLALLSARGSGMALRILASLVVARIAGPEAVGFVSWIGIFSMYALWLTGGVLNGAERRVPIERSQGGPDSARLWSAAAGVTLAAMTACVAIGGGAWLWSLAAGPADGSWKYLAAGCLSAFSLFMNYVTSVFTAEKQFKWLNRLFFIEGLLWWVFLPLAWAGEEGLTLRTLLVTLLPATICLAQARLFHKPRADLATSRELAREGLPILFSRFLLLLSVSLDRTLIAILMDDLALGHYVLATSVIGVMRMIQYAASRVLTPHLGETFGATRDARPVAKATLQTVPALLLLLVPAVVAGWFLMEPLTRWLLPDYLPGVPAGRIALVSGAIASLMSINIFFVSIGRQKTLIAMLLAGLAAQAGATLVLYRANPVLESVAWGFVIGVATSFTLMLGGILYCIVRPVSAKVNPHEET